MINSYVIKKCGKCKTTDNIKSYRSYLYCRQCYEEEKEIMFKQQKNKTFLVSEINKINDNIYLGNSDGAMDKKQLKETGITHILAIGTFLHSFFPEDFSYKIIEVEDDPEEDISSYFIEAFKYIESADKIFIHCFAGVSRSASIVIAYLMWKKRKDYKLIYSYVKDRRMSINPNNGFKVILLDFDYYLKKNDYIIDIEGTERNLSKELLKAFY